MDNNIETCSRRPHKKSRNGCKRCKLRKVKCDERMPACTNCLKHSVTCDYLQQQTTSSPSSIVYQSPYGGPPQYSTPYTNGSPYVSPILPIPSPAESHVFPSDGSLPSLNMVDLELLHNFCNTTSNTLHSNLSMKSLWRVNVPQLAFSYDFVMRGILALSALHLAYHRPQKRDLYLSYATAHHNAGLIGATLTLPNVSENNCTALYIFTAMCCIINLASPRNPSDFLVIGDAGIAEWLTLFRGTRSIIEANNKTLREGPLGPMFIQGARRFAAREQCEVENFAEGERLLELQSLIRGRVSDPNEYHIYSEAILELRRSYATVYQSTTPLEAGDIFIWLFKVSDDYLALLKDRTQEALSIFAFFSVIPKKMEMNWWIEGFSAHLMARIYELLDEEHRLWVRWPIDDIGWVPS